jgi:Exonuclease III
VRRLQPSPLEDRDVYDPKRFVGATHVSGPEREALAELCRFGLVDGFRQLYEDPKLFTWWDYRAGDFHSGGGCASTSCC